MKSISESILVADDDPFIQDVLGDRLESLGYHVLKASDGTQALEIIDRSELQMAFLDVEMPGMKGLDVLKEIHRREKDFPVVVITAYGTIDLAVQAMKEGAYDFVPKPFQGSHITLVVQKALERQKLKTKVAVLSDEVDKRYQLVCGKSGKLNNAIAAAKKAATSRSTILLLGESGVGKELFARAIHNWSDRKDFPFIAINCVGLSTNLLESELFGYEKGAFTGAQQRKKGKMELAQGGTILLDEIGDICIELQTKLLRFLQEREFERVGGTELIRVDVRIIAATNRDLYAAVKDGRFREDLYYRINVVPILLPPLRERKEDIPSLVEHFIHWFSNESKKTFTNISEEAVGKLMAYDWPGNVRELANIIERAVVLGKPPKIDLDDLPAAVLNAESDIVSADSSYHHVIDAYRREVLVNALAETAGNRTAAAKRLGLDRSYFLRLIKSFDIT